MRFEQTRKVKIEYLQVGKCSTQSNLGILMKTSDGFVAHMLHICWKVGIFYTHSRFESYSLSQTYTDISFDLLHRRITRMHRGLCHESSVDTIS